VRAAGATAAVRRAAPEDAAAIVALLEEVAAEGWLGIAAPHGVEAERRALAAAPPQDFAVWVAEERGRVLGHLLLARGERPFCGHTASVAVAVGRGRRGRGIGGSLLDAAAAWAARNRVRKLCAGVFADNLPALRLFEGRGFAREGVRRAQFLIEGVARDEVLLARFLG
jgi:L-amino acid N-acyltransferase YncA